MRKQLRKEEWGDRLLSLSSGNKGANVLLEEAGENIAENMPFRNIEYDSANKGNDLVIALGTIDADLRHTVQSPTELYLHQNSDGVIASLEIKNSKGIITMLRFI